MLKLNNLDKMFFDDALMMITKKSYLPAIGLLKRAIDIRLEPDYFLELAELYYTMGDILQCKGVYCKLFLMTKNIMYSVLSLKELSVAVQDKSIYDFFLYNSFLEIVMNSPRQMEIYTNFFNDFLKRFNHTGSMIVSIEDRCFRRKRLMKNLAKAERMAVSAEEFLIIVKEAIALSYGEIYLPIRAFDDEEVLPNITEQLKAFIKKKTLTLEIAETFLSLKIGEEIYDSILDYFFEKGDGRTVFLVYTYSRTKEQDKNVINFFRKAKAKDYNWGSKRGNLSYKIVDFLLEQGFYDESFLIEYYYKAIFDQHIKTATKILDIINIFVSQFAYELCLGNSEKALDNLLPFKFLEQKTTSKNPINFYLWLFKKELTDRKADVISDSERLELLKLEYNVFKELQVDYNFSDTEFMLDSYYYFACLDIDQKTKKNYLYEYLALKRPKQLTLSNKGSVYTYLIVEPDEPKIRKLYYKAISCILILYSVHKIKTKELLMEAYAMTQIDGFDNDIEEYFETLLLALIRNYTNIYVKEIFKRKNDRGMVGETSNQVLKKYLTPRQSSDE